jgi:hypothetical protein
LVIGRAFAARPRRVEINPIETSESQAVAQPVPQAQDGNKKKRKRH